MSEPPAPGLYHDVDFPTYRSWNAVNSGVLRWGTVTPKHLRCALDGRMETADTPDLKLGRAAHLWVLEGDAAFHSVFKVAGKCCAATGKGDVCGNSGKFIDQENYWYCGVHVRKSEGAVEPEEIITAEEFSRIQAMRDALKAHPVNFHLARPGFSEVSAVWEVDGVTYKGRLDRYAPENDGLPATIIDFKKVQVGKGSRRDCEKAIADRRYHLQLGLYAEAVRIIEGVDEVECVWVFQEDSPPFDVNVIPADQQTLLIAEQELASLRRQLKLVRERPEQAWGYCDSPLALEGLEDEEEGLPRGGLPEWYRRAHYQKG